MYAYIYDSFVSAAKYRKTLERIELRLSHVGIRGKIRRLNVLHHHRDAIEESVRGGATTIVLVGNDRLVTQTIDTIVKHRVVVGLIPFGDDRENHIARILGIPPGELACDVLSRRRILQLDLGMAGHRYFLTTARLNAPHFEYIGENHSFRVRPNTGAAVLTIANLNLSPRGPLGIQRTSPRDGFLEVVIEERPSRFTQFFTRKTTTGTSVFPITTGFLAEPEEATLTLDGCRTVKLPTTIHVAPKKFRMIVGRTSPFLFSC